MASTRAQMTKKEFQQMLSAVMEQKLLELLGDPDEGLILREKVRKRLVHQRKAVDQGRRGESFDVVMRRLGVR